MKFYKFSLELKHDNGKFKVITVATDEESAIDLVMRNENCPRSAIVSITTLKQI
jgi:hypothetical protein